MAWWKMLYFAGQTKKTQFGATETKFTPVFKHCHFQVILAVK